MTDRTSSPAYRGVVLAMLLLVYTFNFLDRQILGILAGPIKAELGLTDTQLGALGGIAFALLYSTLAIPLALRLDALGWTLEEVLRRRDSVVSRWVVHHVSPWGNAPAGSQVFPDRISKAFTAARALAGIPDEIGGKGAPTFHEIRSLAKRLYAAQGGVDTKALLGHSTDEVAQIYLDERDGSPPPAIKVQIG